jgi:hypothetical protein
MILNKKNSQLQTHITFEIYNFDFNRLSIQGRLKIFKFYYVTPIFRDGSRSSRLYKSIFRGGSNPAIGCLYKCIFRDGLVRTDL